MKVSFIIPVYNVEKYLQQCLNSVFMQELDDFEVICVNDGSTDKSLEILKQYQSKIKIISQNNSGASCTRNVGIRSAIGDYLFFLDGDDFLQDAESLRKAIDFSIDNKLDICICNALVDGKSKYLKGLDVVDGKIGSGKKMMQQFYDKFRTIVTPVWMHIYRRDFLISNQFFQKEKSYHEDELFSPIVLFNANKVGCLDVNLVHYRWQRDGAVTAAFTKKHISDWLEIGRDLYSYFSSHKIVDYEPVYRQIFAVYIGLSEALYEHGIKSDGIFEKSDYAIMKQCAKVPFEQKSYKLLRLSPSLMVKYRNNTLKPVLRKLINRFV